MCGITGWVDWERDLLRERVVAADMAATMACRGPDAEGLWVSSTAMMAQRRLAVLDVAGGVQPMSAGPAILIYSGEIYNFQELRSRLESFGRRFHTTSDTEVLLHAYLQWGQKCVDQLNGMYAFAIWNIQTQTLLLVRDRLGIKPLYYAEHPSGLLFGSEPKSLIANPLFQSEIDGEGLAELFTMPPGKTPRFGIFRGLQELGPGCLLQLDRTGKREETYWKLVSRPHPDDLTTTVTKVRALLEDTVLRQMVSDVPLCSLLSGGVDSSALTALAARVGERWNDGQLRSFSVDFSDSPFRKNLFYTGRDAPYARVAAEYLGTRHREVQLNTDDLLAHQSAPILARDFPGMGDMDVSLYLLFRSIREQCTVALSGESADELFLGYAWLSPQGKETGTFPWSYPVPDQLDIRSRELHEEVRLDEYQADRYSDALAEVPYLSEEDPVQRRVRAGAYLTLTRFLPALLDRKDRLSMAVGLEVRVPYCDHRLVEYAWNIPHGMNIADGIEKSVLRRAVGDLLPAAIAWRPKSHYPSTQSAAYGQAITAQVRDWLATRHAPARPFVDVAKLKRVLGSGYVTRPALPWLLDFDAWLRIYQVRVR